MLSATYTYDKLKVVAGISHSNFGTIKNVLNAGYVHAPTQVGGIVGFYNSDGSIPIAESAINLGRLSCDDDMVGNAVGNYIKKEHSIMFITTSKLTSAVLHKMKNTKV